ncbi:TATA-box binding [Lentibacillus halodurans]|uniref:TATA-box binding n=1 Tax=Lentibacillus halodurans TaxID=237679 RepID=A0A1I0ZQI0_9BACI|nr:YwmB family TATA-box binding protein [Lentibacillus halodurans]SFB26618.1 TATA-box binding [Lentibacillus halodurans]
MRKLAIILSIYLFMMMSSGVLAKQTDELTDIASIVTEDGVSVDSWQVTIKEEMNRDAIEHITNKLQDENSYKATRTEDEKAVKYSFERAHKKMNISEMYNVVIPKNAMYDAEFVAVLQGEHWNDSIADFYINRVEDIQATYFTTESTKFACLTADVDAKIEIAYFLNQLKQTLQLTNIQTQTDNVETSKVKKIVYGYTPLWEQEITMQKPMNLQMVVQNGTHDSKRVTIGTPMLINEY